MSNVHYTISIHDPLAHLFKVEMRVTPIGSEPLQLSLPNWIPGSYMIRDFSKHILDIKAVDQHGELPLKALSKSQYHLHHREQDVSITYFVYAFDLSVRKAYLDQEFGFINTASSLFQVDQYAEQSCRVTLLPPHPDLSDCQDWRPASGLPSKNFATPFEYGDYEVPSYLELTDYPILYGELDIAEFSVANVPHYVVTVGRHFGDLNRVAKDLTPLCQYHIDTFGELPEDVDQYLFLTMVTDNGFGGLEHLNSTALVCSRFDIANSLQEIDEGYATFLSLCSHEYLHTWNVKRLKPKEFIPYPLSQEVYTEQLWFYEGMTSYFDDLSLVQTQTIEPKTYLDTLAKTFTRIEKGQGQIRQSVTESSFFSWTKFYQQDHTAPDQIVSYYQKGAAIACLTDALIQRQSDGALSLRDLMKQAWQQYGRNGVGTTQQELEQLFVQFIGAEHRTWLMDVLYQAKKIELAPLLAYFGLEVNLLAQTASTQTHGNIGIDTKEDKATSVPNWLGAVTAEKGGLLMVKQVLNDSPIERAGVAVGDELIALDGMRISSANLAQLLKRPYQNPVELIYVRKDQVYKRDINMASSPTFLVQLRVKDQAKLNNWLNL